MNIDTRLDLLKQIKKVDIPPFMLTRIRQQLNSLANVEAPVKWKWAFAFSAMLILVLNVSILLKSADEAAAKKSRIESVVKAMNLTTSNNLYNE